MDKKQLILKDLKTKAKAFGFTRKELESVAADLANNLELEEEATEEEANAEVAKVVDAVLPILKLSQSAAGRAIQSYMDAHPVAGNNNDDESDEDDDDSTPPPTPKKTPKKGSKVKTTTVDDTPEWAKRLFERLDKIEGNALEDKRQSKLKKLVENTGSFGTRTMRNFNRMKFESDEDFEDFLEEVQSDLEALNQERANDGLSKLGNVPSSKTTAPKENQVELMSDEELDKLANEF